MRVKSAFEELGFENAPELETKSRLVRFIVDEVRKRKLTQSAAGEILGLDQPNVSALMNERIGRFSVEKLMEFTARLGFNVSIHVEGQGAKLDVPIMAAE